MGAFRGTGTLLRLWLRRDRIMLPVWLYALAGSLISTALSFKSLYDTPAEVHDFASGIGSNGSMLAMYGRIHAESLPGLVAWRMGTIGAALVGMMSVFLVVRHTRAEEETGRLELVGSASVGRRAPLTAGLLVAIVGSVSLGVIAVLSLGFSGLPWVGSVAFGLSWTGVGLVFAGVAAVAAQLTENARTARSIALSVLGLAFLMRAVGDGAVSWMSWASPLGWVSLVRPFAGERWWLLLAPLALTSLLVWVAFRLAARRDLGAGLFPARLGPAVGSLRGSFGLAWRLQRGALFGWTAAFLVYGAAIGGIADGVADLLGDSEGSRDIITKLGGTGSLTDAFLAATFGILGLIAAGYAIQSALRLHGEETGQRLEPLLATTVGRLRWTLSHLVVTMAGTALILAAGGLATGVVHALRVGDGSQVLRLTGAALAQAPAAWVLAGATVLLFGLLPRASQAAWGLLAACLLLGQLGPMLDLSQPLMDLSPFTHASKLPGHAATPAPFLWLTASALALLAVGLYGFRRRDVTA